MSQMSLNFSQKQKQSLRQTQRLIMSPQMQQAIHLLQLPVLELAQAIQVEMDHNPILEYSQESTEGREKIDEKESEVKEVELDKNQAVEDEVTFSDADFEVMKHLDEEFTDHFSQSEGGHKSRTSDDDKLTTFLESSIRSEESLFDFLMNQAYETFDEQDERALAEMIIGNLDEKGFLSTSLEEIALLNDCKEEDLKEILDEVQRFEPHGIAAANLQHSLLIQLRNQGKKETLAYTIIEIHYDDLLNNRIPLIQKSLKVSATDIREAIETAIRKLDLQPAGAFRQTTFQQITPDISVVRDEGVLKVKVHNERLPALRLSTRYLKMLEQKDLPEETREYVTNKINSGKWLLRNIDQRNDTLTRITEYLLEHQHDFFDAPGGKLNPLTMKQVAEALEVHESTIARAVANKYVHCERGAVALRSFFTNAYETQKGESISSSTVKDVLLEIIENENKCKPLSDEAISKMIKNKGISCARRTVAKYRKELNIGNTTQRRMYT